MSVYSASTVDPNTMTPSPPTSVYYVHSNESLRPDSDSRIDCSRSSATSKKDAPISETATQLPFSESYQIIKYAAKELESMSFSIYQDKAPELLKLQGIECAEQIELNKACRQLQRLFPELAERISKWLPDIRHLNVHRNKMTAKAFCKTFNEAASIASALEFEEVAGKLKSIAIEMDWCRSEMVKRTTILHKDLPESLNTEISQRLKGVLKAAEAGTQWEAKDHWEISGEVLGYTFEQKLEENPWSDPQAWGQNLDRKYLEPSRSSSEVSSSQGSPTVDREGTWRRKASKEAGHEQPANLEKKQAYVPPAKRCGWSPSRGRGN